MKNETDNTNIDFDSQSQDKRLSSAAGLSDFGVDKAMTWTKERPTQEGWYWIGAYGSSRVGLRGVKCVLTKADDLVLIVNPDGSRLDAVDWDRMLWHGPIEVPAPPNAEMKDDTT